MVLFKKDESCETITVQTVNKWMVKAKHYLLEVQVLRFVK